VTCGRSPLAGHFAEGNRAGLGFLAGCHRSVGEVAGRAVGISFSVVGEAVELGVDISEHHRGDGHGDSSGEAPEAEHRVDQGPADSSVAVRERVNRLDVFETGVDALDLRRGDGLGFQGLVGLDE